MDSPVDEALGIERVDEDQNRRALQRLSAEVSTLLTENENILYVAYQGITALGQAKDSIVATNNRLIIYRRHWFGRMSFEDFLWEDIKDVTMSEGMVSSSIECLLIDGTRHSIVGIKKKQARTLYSISQQKEQEWRERRRVRDLEEERARAGGTQIAIPTSGVANEVAMDPVSRLKKAKEMFDQELISEAEYETLKANILQKM